MSLANLVRATEARRNETESVESRFLKEYNLTVQALERETRQPVPVDYVRPSSSGGCTRMLYLMVTGAERDDVHRSAENIGITDNGTDRHKRIQHVLSKMPNVQCLDLEDIASEARAQGINTEFVGWDAEHTEARMKNDDFHIYFQPDGYIRFGGLEMLVEIKTITTFGFSKLVEPKPEHKMQATCYAMGLGVRWVLFIYEDRNFLTKKIFLVNVTDEMVAEVRGKIDGVFGARRAGVAPPKEPDKCRYCEFKQSCEILRVQEVPPEILEDEVLAEIEQDMAENPDLGVRERGPQEEAAAPAPAPWDEGEPATPAPVQDWRALLGVL